MRRASMSSPESVSSRIASFGSSIAIWKISFFFFSPPEKPSFTAREVSFASSSTDSALLAHQAQELGGRQRLLAAELALFVHGQLHEIGHRDARYLDRVLEAEEQAQARPVFDTACPADPRPRNVAEPSVTVNFSLPASTDASVDLPEPLGPMMACTSPALDARGRCPVRISLPSTLTHVNFLRSNISCPFLFISGYPTEPSSAYRKQLLRLDGEFHRQFGQHLAGVAVDDQSRRHPRSKARAGCSRRAGRRKFSRWWLRVRPRPCGCAPSITGKVCAPHLSPISSESHCE